MGLIGKIALIGVVVVAVLIAVIWDVQNEAEKNGGELDKTTNAEEIKKNLPEHIKTQETPSPETPQEQTPAVIEQPEGPGEPDSTRAPDVIPEQPTSPGEQTHTPVEEPGPDIPDLPGTGQKYIIEKNDNLHKIARKFYGSEKHWPSIHAANLDKIPDPEVLKVGTEIVIPPRDEVLREAPKPSPGEVETYIVSKGDTLTNISRMHFGSDAYVDLIYQANKDKIKDKNVLTVGTELVIPPLPPKKPK
jgi:nucleoid-associated protein YgaU